MTYIMYIINYIHIFHDYIYHMYILTFYITYIASASRYRNNNQSPSLHWEMAGPVAGGIGNIMWHQEFGDVAIDHRHEGTEANPLVSTGYRKPWWPWWPTGSPIDPL